MPKDVELDEMYNKYHEIKYRDYTRYNTRDLYFFTLTAEKKSNAGYAGQVETTHQDGHL